MGVSASTKTPASEFKPVIIIPVYNHHHAIATTLSNVLAYGYPVLLVDDGSDQPCRDELIRLSQLHEQQQVTLLRLDENGGKGAAVKSGFRALLEKGFSHAVQIDADGQHDLENLPQLMEKSKEAPETLIAGYPEYDASVPAGRYYARYLTHVWVWINTLSFTIKDSMCGFRAYPLVSTVKMLDEEPCGDRMDFDTEIVVRWVWRGGKVINVPTKVHYPTDGVSHFRVFDDNVLISLMHTRLFFGMLWRLPKILWNKRNG